MKHNWGCRYRCTYLPYTLPSRFQTLSGVTIITEEGYGCDRGWRRGWNVRDFPDALSDRFPCLARPGTCNCGTPSSSAPSSPRSAFLSRLCHKRSNVDGVRGKREQMALIREVFFSRASRASTPSCIPRISHHSRLKSDFASTDSCRGDSGRGGRRPTTSRAAINFSRACCY